MILDSIKFWIKFFSVCESQHNITNDLMSIFHTAFICLTSNLTHKEYLSIVNTELGTLFSAGGNDELFDTRAIQVPDHPLATVNV